MEHTTCDANPKPSTTASSADLSQLAAEIKQQALHLGFADVAIVRPEIDESDAQYQQWLEKGYHGEMHYLANNIDKRFNPAELVPGTSAIVMVRMNYVPPDVETIRVLNSPDKGYVARYTLGRDYHKLLRQRLKQLAQWIEQRSEREFQYRPFVDSAPVLERTLARNAGMGWIGKNTLLLNRSAGSLFLLGELFVNLPLPADEARDTGHCGQCTACIDTCPTQAFPEAGVLDARRCISYLTIEYRGSIPLELRPLMGNRIFGCDDCQLICPWNRFAQHSLEDDFQPRHKLNNSELLTLFNWSEAQFLRNTEGSAIRRTGYEGWLRNIAIALGNSGNPAAIPALEQKRDENISELVNEHIEWALEQLRGNPQTSPPPMMNHKGARRLREDI